MKPENAGPNLNKTDWIWTDHIRYQMLERKIGSELVGLALENPDAIVSDRGNCIVYNKVVGGKLIRVVTNGNKLITVYATTKIAKYLKE
ncbi:MAG: DUF4258 domain-containing protein [Nitrospirae bacterium]|nr:DUF4258 domain-containing protein [Nitrospirota bacterium]